LILAKGKEAEAKIKENSGLRIDLAKMIYENDIKNAEFITKQTPEIITAYLNQDKALLKNVESGMKWLNLQIEYDKLGGKGKRAKAIWEEVQAMTAQDKENYVLAKGLNKLIDTQKDKITTDLQEIESSKQSAINLRVSSKLDALTAKDQKKTQSERLKDQQDYQTKSLKLADDYEKSQIESLTGIEKLKAQREFGIKQIKEIRDQLAKLGVITPEQMAMLEAMGNNVWKAYYKGVLEEAKRVTPKQQEEITKALLGEMPELPGLQKMTQNTVENLEKALKGNEAMEPFSIWKLIGIDPESDEGSEQIEAIKEVASTINGVLEESLQQRVEIAQRRREILDTQISELQNEIELEAELMQEGFANNLDLKKRELDGLKKQREEALKAEEKAVRQEQLLSKITQTTNILSGVSNIIAVYSKIPVLGLILAAASIASLFAIWSKAKTTTATATALAEGGSGTEKGMITGRRHSQGGERFLDHIEVERGEAFGVLSRGATEKYGNIFHNMVSSFNKDAMPDFIAPAVSNSIRVENSGPNSRLDKVNTSINRLNQSLLRQSQVSISGNKRIIKNGNKIRIIG
jgi:hypothetical protein